jgi:hypothetical protein
MTAKEDEKEARDGAAERHPAGYNGLCMCTQTKERGSNIVPNRHLKRMGKKVAWRQHHERAGESDGAVRGQAQMIERKPNPRGARRR